MKHMFTEDGPSECHLEAAVDSIPRTLTAGQVVEVIRAYALQIILALLRPRVFSALSHGIEQLHDVGGRVAVDKDRKVPGSHRRTLAGEASVRCRRRC